MSQLRFGTSSYSYLWGLDFDSALEDMSAMGFTRTELMASFPHPYRAVEARGELRNTRRTAERLGIEIVGINPPGLDLNLASPDPDVRDLSVRRYVDLVEAADALGSAYLVVVPGRRHPLLPAPMDLSTKWLSDGLTAILRAAMLRNVQVVLENTPSNFLDLADELVHFVSDMGDPEGLFVCYDVANAYMREDPADGLRRLKERALVIHLSDTTAQSWMHAPIGAGEVEFSTAAEAVLERSDSPYVMLETIHRNDVTAGLRSDWRELAARGWSIGLPQGEPSR